MTGIEFQPVKQSIREEDELALQKPIIPTYHNNEQLAEYKKQLAKPQYNAIISAFEQLWGKKREDQMWDAQVDGVAILTEANFMRNIKHVIGVDEPYFGKCLYLWMA